MNDITNIVTSSSNLVKSPSMHYMKKSHSITINNTKSPSKIGKSHNESQRLKNKRSRLDLIDNSQFTSFPLAPPPHLKKDHQKVTEFVKRSPKLKAVVEDEDLEEIYDTPDRSMVSEIDEPIIFIEDYIQQRSLKSKKISVLDLRKSMNLNETNEGTNYMSKAKLLLNDYHGISKMTPGLSSYTSSLLLTNVIEEDNDQISIISTAPTVKLSLDDSMIIPEFSHSTTSLKYCIICENPLYELSSHLCRHENNEKFNEFVCSSCTERYETLSRLIEEHDEIYEDERKRQKLNNQFSKELIGNLQSHLNNHDKAWFEKARKTLRWRWRLTGLLPKFLGQMSSYS
ncbi:hypothetical protein WICMUC_005648 [Wickerhamomyces mucosus]|uniref:Uncharacterized protein n=1 Tax=Wickerhamomyces mucosus TaxID=1378264 RepID=A0A9P8T5S9_9ASCO|nr:hypothetical protein WICMUC_005648 [Wickerhamomyces mucosus]